MACAACPSRQPATPRAGRRRRGGRRHRSTRPGSSASDLKPWERSGSRATQCAVAGPGGPGPTGTVTVRGRGPGIIVSGTARRVEALASGRPSTRGSESDSARESDAVVAPGPGPLAALGRGGRHGDRPVPVARARRRPRPHPPRPFEC